MRKKLLQYIKTRHFKERQKERCLSDAKIKETILKGEMVERDGLTVFKLKNVEIIASEDDILITIINKGPLPSAPKALTKEQAKHLKEIIKTSSSKLHKETRSRETISKFSEKTNEVEIDLESYLQSRKDNKKRW